MQLSKRCIAEVIGTFWLVFGGCGSAVLAAMFSASMGESSVNLGIGFVGVAFAFGLTVLTMAYAIGHISGCHHFLGRREDGFSPACEPVRAPVCDPVAAVVVACPGFACGLVRSPPHRG